MDPQIFQLINERSDRQDQTLERIETLLYEHISKDEGYWKKIDRQDGQVGLLKWIFGGTLASVVGAFFTWLISTIKG